RRPGEIEIVVQHLPDRAFTRGARARHVLDCERHGLHWLTGVWSCKRSGGKKKCARNSGHGSAKQLRHRVTFLDRFGSAYSGYVACGEDMPAECDPSKVVAVQECRSPPRNLAVRSCWAPCLRGLP